ncbi:MAG: MotA/TolQ/ExbB proton channel family protein [Bacteroidia bacterium]|nr:MotA/TolQ/ExbB proton channel family protein [Bacteroidia bacterium]
MELLIALLIFLPWTIFCIVFILRYAKEQKKAISARSNFWSNSLIFEVLPSTWPTIGILCTAIGVIIGLHDFNTEEIQKSIPTLLKGLRLAFYATIVGILGLIIFQKICAIVQKNVDDDPSRPPKQSDEITALYNINQGIQSLQVSNQKGFESSQLSFDKSLEKRIGESMRTLNDEIINIKSKLFDIEDKLISGITQADEGTRTIIESLDKISIENQKASSVASKNTSEIIEAMQKNNQLLSLKFDEFSELLKKNNTEALVEVMKRATEEFNQQMSSLINRLVQENFQELNTSVKSLNSWQKENITQISQLTENFKKTTESFSITSNVLSEVAQKTEALTNNNGKLSLLITELNKVMIEDGKFQEVTNKLISTIEILSKTTNSFDETTNKLNGWVRTQMSFNDKASVIIEQLEAFKNLNGEVWDKYRAKMEESVNIISKASKALSTDLDNINQQFVESLNATLTSLDECIQRIITNKKQ